MDTSEVLGWCGRSTARTGLKGERGRVERRRPIETPIIALSADGIKSRCCAATSAEARPNGTRSRFKREYKSKQAGAHFEAGLLCRGRI
jgi:hypothetical protein